MALSFPNKSRAFDATRRAVRFWGYDSAMEVAFFVTEDVDRVQPDMQSDEAGLLRAFDSHRDLICRRAAKIYACGRKGTIWWAPTSRFGPPATRLASHSVERVKPCGFTFLSRKRGKACRLSRATSWAADFRRTMVPGPSPARSAQTALLPITSLAMRSKKQSMRRGFSCGVSARRRKLQSERPNCILMWHG
jgi:hypothetical protein